MKIGFTSTIPVEVIYASGNTPVDLNNLFVLSKDPSALVRRAKMDGFPDTTCSWICGLYGTALEAEIDTIIGVTGGDCSETLALMEILELQGKRIIPFGYPHKKDPDELLHNIEKLASELGTNVKESNKYKLILDKIRKDVIRLDELLWKDNKALGNEVRLVELSCSDFESNPESFGTKVQSLVAEIEKKQPVKDTVRIGICGVPPIITDMYDHIEKNGCRVVYSEVERQFSIPFEGTIEKAYSLYTYPYGIFERLKDINENIKTRNIDGIIHYVQSFCFRGIEDIALKKSVSVPVLTLQGDLPTRVTETLEIRIEAFIDMLIRRKNTNRK